ncbi:MAG: peptidase M61, partial [Acidobacteria bacterium]|nr:peptidase M61 [Acidobacteriota bacterium]
MKTKLTFLAVVLLGGAAMASAASTQYTVSMPHPETHYFEVSVRVENVTTPHLRMILPVWAPGSYLVREFARQVQDFSASAEHKPLTWQKISKYTWQIETGGASIVELKYRVYANDLGVRSSDLDDEHGYFNGTNLFLYPEGRIRELYKLIVIPFGDWKVATGLDPVDGEKNTFSAPDYDILVDSPVEMGRFELLEFQVRGVPHQMAVHGPTKFDRGRLVGDVRRIVEKQAELFGDIPYKRYLFIVHAGLGGGGGLEHLNSTSLQTAKLSFRKEKDWEGFLD